MDRSAERYQRLWLCGNMALLVLACVAIALWAFLDSARLPAELAVHWNARGEVNGIESLPVFVLTTLPIRLFSAAALMLAGLSMRGQSTLLARCGMAAGMMLGAFILGLVMAIIVGQRDLQDSSMATLEGWPMAASILAAALLGAGVAMLYRPEPAPVPESSQARVADRMANDLRSLLATTQRALAQQSTVLEIGLSAIGARNACLLTCLAAGVAGWWWSLPWLAICAVLGAAGGWILLTGTLLIGPDGVQVRLGGMIRCKRIGYDRIASAHVREIRALDYGGIGYRSNITDGGFIAGSGTAVVLKVDQYLERVFTFQGHQCAARVCALVNAHRGLGAVRR
ncbi:DUF1648 domain-containing protein [Glutamicibacter sp. MNS18]|uniref:DUF1648 domain-containing protein n=1 Tax=Glutamicibacter sp. MNS18 TaxID=2989817 RepID=UPI002235498B|nr:DUF1648 domain-containing protein [Glutamicibacter sp. MNS18]MCW4464931.1 DUF1648 domain-containing protein [Glutamicibacter sp. MNS18]